MEQIQARIYDFTVSVKIEDYKYTKDSFILDKEYVKEFKSGTPISPIVNSFIDFHSLGVILIDSLSGFKISCVQSRSILKLDIGEIDEKFKDFEAKVE